MLRLESFFSGGIALWLIGHCSCSIVRNTERRGQGKAICICLAMMTVTKPSVGVKTMQKPSTTLRPSLCRRKVDHSFVRAMSNDCSGWQTGRYVGSNTPSHALIGQAGHLTLKDERSLPFNV
jgi:hypothetical protein